MKGFSLDLLELSFTLSFAHHMPNLISHDDGMVGAKGCGTIIVGVVILSCFLNL